MAYRFFSYLSFQKKGMECKHKNIDSGISQSFQHFLSEDYRLKLIHQYFKHSSRFSTYLLISSVVSLHPFTVVM